MGRHSDERTVLEAALEQAFGTLSLERAEQIRNCGSDKEFGETARLHE